MEPQPSPLSRRAFFEKTGLAAGSAMFASGAFRASAAEVAAERDAPRRGAGTGYALPPAGDRFAEGWPVIQVGPDEDPATRIGPRRIIELHPGRYDRGLTVRGIEDVVIRARPGSEGEVCFWRCGIRVESSSRIRLEGLTIRQSPATALGIAGPSREIQVDHCSFLACGMPGGNVTLWLGNDTARCRVHACLFDTCGVRAPRHDLPSHVHDIGVMCAEDACVEHVFTGNRLLGYGYGFQLGVTGTCRQEGRHRVEANEIDHPLADGIHVKQARCLVRGTRVHGAARYAISTRAGFGTRVEGNHLTDCQHGIRILGSSHEVVGNIVNRSRRYGLLLSPGQPGGDRFPAENTLVEGNSFRDCGGFDPHAVVPPPGAVILTDGVTAQRIRENRFEGTAAAQAVLPKGWSE